MSSYEITYKLEYENEKSDTFSVEFDEVTGELIDKDSSIDKAWVRLETNKCSHCPLNEEDYPRCPMASGLDHLVEHFKDTKSYWTAKVTVTTKDRIYQKDTDLQNALFGIFGLIMASSACPYMKFLRPMARFHLPFSNIDETMIRSTSMYLLSQFFVAQKGGKGDFTLENFKKHYEDINTVNRGIINRIKGVGKGDTQANVITILDTFAMLLSMEISEDLSGIEKFFK